MELTQEVKKELLLNLITKDRAAAFVMYLEDILPRGYRPATPEGQDKETDPVRFKDLLGSLTKMQSLPDGTHALYSDFVLELKKYLLSVEPLEIVLGFDYTEATLQHVFKWLSENGGGQFLLIPSFSEEMAGGCTIMYKGKYYDFSLDKLLKGFQFIGCSYV